MVDAVPVLMAAAYRGDGALSIEIADKSAPWNEGVFTVEFQDGKAIRAEKTEAAPQISMGIGDFTRLISGCYEGQEIRLMPHVTICLLYTSRLVNCKKISSINAKTAR